MRTVFLLVLVIGSSIGGMAQVVRDQHNVSCLLDLEVPVFAVISGVRKGGHVDASVTLGRDGRAKLIDVSKASHRRLGNEVFFHLSERTIYSESCAGKRVRLLFTFRQEGQPTLKPYPIVRFRP